MKLHPVVDLFPAMPDDQFEALVEDIAKHGVLQPITLYHGQIIDGRHRWKACERLGVKCPTIEHLEDDGSITDLVISLNQKRRHLNDDQLAVVAHKAKPLYAEEAKARMLAGKTLPSNEGRGNGSKHEGTSAHHAAEAVGVSRARVERVGTIAKRAPELLDDIERGRLTIAQASVEAKKRKATKESWPEDQTELRRRLEAGETIVVNLDKHHHVVAWAQQQGLLEFVDRRSEWGNPFKLQDDGTVEEVLHKYEHHYLDQKGKLPRMLPSLRGKALACHCAPKPCHADILRRRADA